MFSENGIIWVFNQYILMFTLILFNVKIKIYQPTIVFSLWKYSKKIKIKKNYLQTKIVKFLLNNQNNFTKCFIWTKIERKISIIEQMRRVIFWRFRSDVTNRFPIGGHCNVWVHTIFPTSQWPNHYSFI